MNQPSNPSTAEDDRRATGSRVDPDPYVEEICATLAEEYGNPSHGNKSDPLDELIYIILSTRTREPRFQELYDLLKARYPTWNQVTGDERENIESLIAPGGLGTLKTRQIVTIMDTLRQLYGHATLDPLRQMSTEDAERFLTDLPGVSAKVAKCVLMYALNREVLPVDVHVHRVAQRLGFKVKKRPDTSQELIEEAIPPHLRYGFHVNAVAHGRAVCRSMIPRCSECRISDWCDYFHNQVEGGGLRWS